MILRRRVAALWEPAWDATAAKSKRTDTKTTNGQSSPSLSKSASSTVDAQFSR
jgi:hypothetical protein